MHFLSFRIFEQLALALKNRVALEIFTCIEIFFIIQDFSNLRLPWKQSFLWNFSSPVGGDPPTRTPMPVMDSSISFNRFPLVRGSAGRSWEGRPRNTRGRAIERISTGGKLCVQCRPWLSIGRGPRRCSPKWCDVPQRHSRSSCRREPNMRILRSRMYKNLKVFTFGSPKRPLTLVDLGSCWGCEASSTLRAYYCWLQACSLEIAALFKNR